MKVLLSVFLSCLFISCSTSKNATFNNDDNKAFEKLRLDLNNAFVKGDIVTITAYHHPDVVKALAYNRFLVGRDAIITDLKETLQSYIVKFTEHKIESFIIERNTATEISTFTIEGTPKGNGKSFNFKGRSMVVYVRYNKSPAGWALLREMIQPATE